MAGNSESNRGARRRTLIPRVRVVNPEINVNRDCNNRRVDDNPDNGKDSGLSSECTTPTGGSPPPRQSKIVVSSSAFPPTSLLATRGKNQTTRIGSTRTSRLLRSRSGTDSPRSQDSLKTRQIASPFRPVFTGNGQSPSLDSGDEGSPRLERCNYHQDIVSIKTGLLKLMRVVQEAETLNPFSTSTLNGLFNNLNDEGVDTNNHLTNGALNIADEMANLRRQVIFLQGQLEDKDRTIQQLQMQVAKQQDLINCADPQNHVASMNRNNQLSRESCNAATQTEKLRPVSAGPSLLQSLPADGSMGPLVSWSENRPTLMYQRPPSLVELNSSKSPRKTSDRLPVRTVKSRQEHTTSSYSVNKSRETIQNIGNRDEHQNEANGDLKKSCGQCIPALKKLTTPTFIPRVTRPDISVTSRLHNL